MANNDPPYQHWIRNGMATLAGSTLRGQFHESMRNLGKKGRCQASSALVMRPKRSERMGY
jgi:hypothetical protein